MADQGQETVDQPEDQDQDQTVELENEDWIPRTRFNEINQKRKQAEEELEKFRKQQAKAQKEAEELERQKLEKQNEFKELYEGLKAQVNDLMPYKERFEAVLAKTQEANSARIEKLPAKYKGLVPDYEDPMKLSEWLNTNQSLFQGGQTPQLDGQAGSGTRASQPQKDTPSAEWLTEQATRLGVDPVLFAKEYGVDLSKH